MNQSVKFKNSDISLKSRNFYNNAISLLDTYNNYIKKNGMLNEEEKNILINLWKNANHNNSLTTKQKEQIYLKITRLFYLSGYSIDLLPINKNNTFFNRVSTYLESLINMLKTNRILSQGKREELIRLKESIMRKKDLSEEDKHILSQKIYLIFNLICGKEDLYDEEVFLIQKNDMVKKYVNYYQSLIDKIVSLSKNNINDIEKIIKLYNDISLVNIFNSRTKSTLLKKITEFVIKNISIDDILSFWKNINYKCGLRIENIITTDEMQHQYFDKILEFLIDCKTMNNLTYKKVLQRLLFREKASMFENLIMDIKDFNIDIEKLQKLIILMGTGDHLKMVSVNNYNDIKIAVDKLKKLLFYVNGKYQELIREVYINLCNLIEEIDKKGIINTIVNGKIDFNRNYDIILPKLNLVMDTYPVIENRNIIAIDDEDSYDLDTAFSIKKDGDVYLLDVYVTDVPSFLAKNRELAKIAYQNGISYYLCDFTNNIYHTIDMLPVFLSHEKLSLNNHGFKNVITFHFVIGDDGEVLSTSISKNKIMLNYNLTQNDAKNILQGKILLPIRNDLLLLKELCKKVSSKSQEKYLKGLRENDLVAITSLLPNYYVGKKADLAIYRSDGIYTKEKKEYTHSVTPLRKFVSDINLGLLLNQLGLLAIDNRDIYLITDNLDEIVNHLNEVDKMSQYVSSHAKQMIKFLKI